MVSQRVAANLICGFLGVGKTTALRHLLRHKPKDEYWAIVLNEFGEVGIDGAIVAASNDGIAVKEIAGGCLCCATAPMLRVGIQRLLHARWPDRLLIEPSGLGHPAKIAAMLKDPWMSRSLALKSVLCIVDAREFAQPKYREHPIYAEQLRTADAIILNKADLASPSEREFAQQALAAMSPPKVILGAIEQGAIPQEWLDVELTDGVTAATLEPTPRVNRLTGAARDRAEDVAGDLGHDSMRHVMRSADGFQSHAWIFPAGAVFVESKIESLFGRLGDRQWLGATAVRAKALVRTQATRWLALNWRNATYSKEIVSAALDSRVEVVLESMRKWSQQPTFEAELRAAIEP